MRSEWVTTVQYLEANWPNAEVSEATLAVWWEDVKDLPAEQVQAAAASWVRDGERFPPTGGILRRRVVEMRLDAPPFAAVLRLLREAAQKSPGYLQAAGDGSTVRAGDDRGAWLEVHAPRSVRDFIAAVGWGQLADTDDNAEARLRAKWDAFLGDLLATETYRGLDTAGLARLERVDRTAPRLAAGTSAALPEGSG